MSAPVVMWFRQDLRLGDNPALGKAVASGQPLICLYVLDDVTAGSWRMGAASLWWLHHSLADLGKRIRALGGSLVLRRGAAADVVPTLVREAGAAAIHWNRCYEPDALARDKALAARFEKDGVAVYDENAALLIEPWSITTKGGEPYKVFTPFWRACQDMLPSLKLASAPKALSDGRGKVSSDELDAWKLLPTKPDWTTGFGVWTPGEDGAKAALALFLDEALPSYGTGHDRPDRAGTSRLSPHLHFGEIGPRQVMRAVRDLTAHKPPLETVGEKFLSEIGWREFSAHLLWQQPALPDSCFRPEYNEFPWTDDRAALKTWQRGMTGWPIVDAGMRQLWQTGWMHNRVRMIVASVLVKHLLVPWQQGEQWFWDTLVDADLASNAANWQWVAGCGADAAPYFRIFNPVLQGEKFDPDGAYVREYVPELAKLPNKFIHKPWEAGAPMLRAAGVKLGETYPEPIIDLQAGRERALSAFAAMRAA